MQLNRHLNPELLKEVTDYYKKIPEWWGIDPNSDLVFTEPRMKLMK